ncbi:MAG: DNA-binding NarL/FixJ family response regulator [Saprospiraceae bacterium]
MDSVLSVNEDSSDIKNAYYAGALGYILKKANRYELEKAVLSVAEGKKYFGQNAMSAMLSDNDDEENITVLKQKVEKLTKKELEIIKLLSEELSSSEIGALLFISTGTVETHRHNILRKLEMKSTIGVVKFAMKAGII